MKNTTTNSRENGNQAEQNARQTELPKRGEPGVFCPSEHTKVISNREIKISPETVYGLQVLVAFTDIECEIHNLSTSLWGDDTGVEHYIDKYLEHLQATKKQILSDISELIEVSLAGLSSYTDTSVTI